MIYNAVGFIEESKEDIDVNRRKMMLTPILKQNILLFYSKNRTIFGLLLTNVRY